MITGLLSLATAATGIQEEYKCSRFWCDLFLFGFRIAAFALFAAYSVTCLFVVMVTHFIVMYVWIFTQEEKSCGCFFAFSTFVLAMLYEVYYVNVYLPPIKYHRFYTIIVLCEDVCSVAVFYIDPTLTELTYCIVIATIVFGCVTMVYKFRKPLLPCFKPYTEVPPSEGIPV